MPEGKFDPILDQPSLSKSFTQELVDRVVKDVRSDFRQRGNWEARHAHFLRRRYTKEDREVDWPWPGSSNIVIPILDMQIERQKPLYIQSTIGISPPATFLANNADSFDRIAVNEIFFEHLLHSIMRDFKREVAYGADNFGQFGRVVWRITWEYRTRLVREVVTRSKLPQEIQSILGPLGFTAAQADAYSRATGVPVVTRSELKRIIDKDQVARTIASRFSLNENDRADKKAIGEILRWLLESDEESVVIRTRSVEYDAPRVIAVPNEDFIVPPWTYDIQDARRITYRYYMSPEQIVQKARDRKWPDSIVDKILSPDTSEPYGSAFAGRQIERSRALALDDVAASWLGYGMSRSDLFEFWETCLWADLDDDGEPEKLIVDVHPATGTLASVRELPYQHGRWPYETCAYETIDKRFYNTRGICEKLNDLDAEITLQHRMKLNRMMIANAPTFLYRSGSIFNPDLVRWIPGQFMPATSTADVRELPVSNVDISFEREEQIALGLVERYMGALDSAITNQQQLTRPRTATEIESISQLQAQVGGPRVLAWQDTMMRVYDQVWDLWQQYGSDEVFLKVTGDSNPRRVTRADLLGDFSIVPTPAALSNPATRIQEAKLLLDTLVALAQQAPQFIGPETELRLDEAARAFVEAVDPRLARVVMRRRTPEEVQAINAQIAERAQPSVDLTGDLSQVRSRIDQLRRGAEAGQNGPRGRIVP